MDIQPIDSENLYIYICGAELENLPRKPQDMRSEDASEILKAALGGEFLGIWENAYLELHFGREALLLFARRPSEKSFVFRFSEFESVIGAVRCCQENIISYLSLFEEEYYLVLYPWRDRSPPYPFF